MPTLTHMLDSADCWLRAAGGIFPGPARFPEGRSPEQDAAWPVGVTAAELGLSFAQVCQLPGSESESYT